MKTLKNKLQNLMPKRINKALVVTGVAVAGFVSAAHAQTDATVITTGVTSAFVGVAGACVTIGTFFVVYRLVKRIK